MKNSTLKLRSSLKGLLSLFIVQGCTSLNSNNDSLNENISNGTVQIEKHSKEQKEYNRKEKGNFKKKIVTDIEREIQYLTMDLLAKLNEKNIKKTIIVSPITLADEMPSEFIQVREHITYLFINELFEFGFPVIESQNKRSSELTLESNISLYQGSYIINTYIKSTDSGQIQSMAKSILATNLLEQLEDGVRVLR